MKPGPRAKARGGTLKRAPHERGSALLIVFVFAAMVAIMLYEEMPVAAFEARRQKEQLLVDRGNEYAHAVKLFVRKTGTYPASLDALENTNNMRFLRHRFVDPFTGKDDWRLLHAGPGGVLIDSKVNPLNSNSNSNANSANGKAGSQGNSSFSNTASGFSNTTTFASASATSNTEPTVVKSVPQRAPAIPADGTASAQTASADQDPTASLLAQGQAEQLTDNSPAMVDAQATTPANGQPGAGVGQSGAAPSATDMMRNLASNPNPQTPRANTSNSTSGRMMGGGIAGVASNAKGESIKSINDQTDYSLWEFYYDPSKDLAPGMNGAMQTGARQAGQNSTTQNGFGSSSFSQSSTSPNLSNSTSDSTNIPAMMAPRRATTSSPQQ